jgi:hypothetical protein
MSAPPINAAAPPSTGPAPGIGAAASAAQATGPLAGFEALLAAFFGAQGDLAVGGQASQAATGKAPGAAASPITDALKAPGDATAAAATDDPSTASADAAAAAAAAAACNAALILPVAGQPIAAPVAAGTGETVEGAPTAMAPSKSFTPTFAPAAKGQPIDVDGDATETAAGAEPGPNATVAGAAAKTAKLDPSPATSLSSPAQPAAPVTPPQAPVAASPPPPPVVTPPEAPVVAPVTTPVAEALAAPQAAAEARPAGPAAPAPKTQVSKAAPGQHARIDVAAPGQAKSASEAMAATNIAANAAEGDDAVQAPTAKAAEVNAKGEAPETPAGSADAAAATASTTNPTTQVHPGAIPVRGAPQTVANLAAQIAKKLEGRSTRFDVQLDPAGLGRVDVRMEIGASGRMTAAMTFDTPQAAAELRARAAELQRHLEQAGFDMSGGLSFDVAGDRGQGRQAQQNQDNDSGQAFRGRAFQQALATAGDADQSAASGALNLRRSLLSGVDIRI